MPPVRWKLLTVTTILFLERILYAYAQIRHDEISVDGWRPIIGLRKPNFQEAVISDNSNYYKYEVFSTPPPPTITVFPSVGTVGPSKPPIFRGSPKPQRIPVRKIPHQKPNPFFALPTHESRGPHIPLGAVIHTRPSQIGHIKPLATIKPFIQVSSSTKRAVKPVRMQTSTSRYRDEIFTASASSGAFQLFRSRPNNIRTRETIDLGIPGTNQFTINQPHAHIDFANRFALPPNTESVYQQYNPQISQFIFEKHPQANDINYQFPNQNEDFTRTLIPPPHVYRNKNPSSRGKDAQFISQTNTQDNVVLQVPPPFQYSAQKINEPPVQVQVTKEKIQEYHNNIPDGYHGQYVQYDFPRKPTEIEKPVYEIEEPPTPRPVRTRKPTQKKQRRPDFPLDVPVFLPTPFKPETLSSIEPTSPTQSEVSTIFTKLSQLQREKEITTPNPFAFNVKEVSTHYPILGEPIFREPNSSPELSNEVATQNEDVTTTTEEPQRIRPHRRRRPEARRTTTTTTTEEPIKYNDSQQTQEEVTHSVEIKKAVRVRRPLRYRTSARPTSNEEITTKSHRGRNRYRHRNNEDVSFESIRKRPRPTWAETSTMPENHKIEDYSRPSPQQSYEIEEATDEKSEEIDEPLKAETIEFELPGRQYPTEAPQQDETREEIKPFMIVTTTEKNSITNLHLPENEVALTSTPDIIETTSTEAPTATTTIVPSTINRIKNRPFKFDNSNRPRFSVKDYRQKLSQYSSTSTTATPRITSDIPKIRLPNRIRRPLSSTPINIDEDSTETARPRFIPKDPRHSTTESTNVAIISDKNVKSVNTRLRPFGRQKSTTPSTTTPKVSIKPNLFNRKRPPMISLRSRIFSKHNKTNIETSSDKMTTTEGNEIKATTEDVDFEEVESTSQINNLKIDKHTENILNIETTTNVNDFSEIDPYYYSQRVSDLTSSSDYNTPGLFKSVSPTSRRIPNHFTMITDDPILPIEAFFSNIKDQNKDKNS